MPSDPNASTDALVSIICRTIGRPHLADAVASVAAQTYSNIEIVLVKASTFDSQKILDAYPSLNCIEVGGDQNLSRSAAANAGLEAANGRYCMFLDDDDWVSESHVAVLITALQDQSAVKAAYSCTQKTLVDGSLLDETFRQPYDPALLLRDNFIPIHSVLFERSLVKQGCKFDSQFEIFEDWDFWLQVSQHTPFLFVDQVTAFYRGGGESETGQNDISVRYQPHHILGKARAKLFDKWLSKWTGNELNQILGSMDQADLISSLQADIKELDNKLDDEHRTNLSHQDHIKGLLSEAETLRAEVDTQKHRLVHLNELNEDLKHHNESLQSLLTRITDSLPWKLTAPLRYLIRLVRGKQVNTESEQSVKKKP